MYKVRFHLAKGEHYMHWQIRGKGSVLYYDPQKISLSLDFCKLKNRPSTAMKIFNGGNKRVCAWVDCVNYSCYDKNDMLSRIDNYKMVPLSFNPRAFPYWTIGSFMNSVDNYKFLRIVSFDNELFAVY